MRKMLPVTALLPLALAACSGMMGGQQAPQSSAATGSPFTQALASEYRQFTDSEYAQQDWPDTYSFRDKAQMAAEGRTPTPEDPTKRGVGTGLQLHPEVDIGKEQRGEAIAGRQRLMAALAGEAPRRNPQAAARAQVAYDCWVEQLEEGWQRDDIERCRKAFNTAMGEMEARPIAQTAPGERLQVYFAFDSSQLTQESRQAIASAARDIKARAGTSRGGRIEVDGHADRSGSDTYNEQLSQARAQAVRQELLAEGVPANRITMQAYGERAPQVPTPDGVAQPENRRTVVEFD
ncbi:MAG: OmpA family protein [Rhodospirillaceae bacterium]|nr:OmpA family protein [Rhodospirillales bacterium]